MAKFLSIANKLLSLRGRMHITNEYDELLYEAKGEFSFSNPVWQINMGENQMAAIRRKVFSWSPTWMVQSGLGYFQIKRKIFSWSRQYYAVGGLFDGALITGNFWDLNFKVEHDSKLLARASGKILTLRDRHNIEVFEQGELFVVIAMVVLHLDRKDEQRQRSEG